MPVPGSSGTKTTATPAEAQRETSWGVKTLGGGGGQGANAFKNLKKTLAVERGALDALRLDFPLPEPCGYSFRAAFESDSLPIGDLVFAPDCLPLRWRRHAVIA